MWQRKDKHSGHSPRGMTVTLDLRAVLFEAVQALGVVHYSKRCTALAGAKGTALF